MNKTLTIALIAALIVGTGVTSAYAAKIVDQFKDNGEEFVDDLAEPLCGEASEYYTVEWNAFGKLWDNDKTKYHESAQYNIYNSTDDLVGIVPIIAINYQGSLSNPQSFNYNFAGDGYCIYNDITFPGIDDEFHCGSTIQKDGDEIAHSVYCSP